MQPLVEILPNGCELLVLPQPHATRAAMAVQFSIGSYHAPEQWPGLAHFLEHLLFLGGERFLGAQRLMPYVQGCGGQLNATTGGTYTQFYFETSPSQFQGAAERLLDMLVSPRLALDDQSREREVIDAEYCARAADAVQLGLSALQHVLAPDHPLSGFHAGNRKSLVVENADFQAALREFHAGGYRGPLARVVLVGPQSNDELLADGRQWGEALPAGTRPLKPVPALAAAAGSSWQLQLEGSAPRLWLGVVLSAAGVPMAQASLAIALVLGSRLPGGLCDHLIMRGWVTDLVVHRLYDGQDEVVLGVEVALSDPSHASLVKTAVADWLCFLGRQIAEGAPLALAERPLGALTPLQAARQCLVLPLDQQDWLRPAVREALHSMLSRAAKRLSAVLAGDAASGRPSSACGFAVRMDRWEPLQAETQLTFATLPCNPLFEPLTLMPADRPACLTWHPRHGTEAVLFLRCRWGTNDSRPPGAVKRATRAVTAAGEQLGARMTLDETPTGFNLKCCSGHQWMPVLIWHLLAALRGAEQISAPLGPPDEMPLRRLLRALPDCVQPPLACPESPWEGLLVGLDEPGMRRLSGALELLATVPGGQGQTIESFAYGRRVIDCAGEDAAVLLFYPVADRRPETEAAWRVLGQWLAPRFYQRVRGELQLGYGVFCGFQQIAGQSGVLLAVQSPTTSCDELIGHIETFIAAQQAVLAGLDGPTMQELVDATGRRLAEQGQSIEGEAELLWQAHLAGLPQEHPAAVLDAFSVLSQEALQEGMAALSVGADVRLALSSGA